MLNKDDVLKIMKNRGYESTSHNESGNVIVAINFIKHLKNELIIHAKVTLKSETVSLSFVELKYFCQLSIEQFAFDHKDFEKYEQILMIYAAKCLDVEVFQVLALLPIKNQEVKPEKKDIKTRKRELWDKIVVEGKEKKYQKEMCLEFYNYWTEMNEGGRKMRFEMERIFDIKRRLTTWLSHDKKWSKTFVDQKIEKQDKEVNKSTSIKKKDLF